MASQPQVDLFKKLQDERELGDHDPDTLLSQFERQSQDAASDWIEKALKAPRKDSAAGDNSPPPF